MTYRIRRSEAPEGIVFALSGDMDAEHTGRLEDLLRTESSGPILLDLQELTLVAREAVRLLARAEARGIRILNCPEYVRRWIAAERNVPASRSV